MNHNMMMCPLMFMNIMGMPMIGMEPMKSMPFMMPMMMPMQMMPMIIEMDEEDRIAEMPKVEEILNKIERNDPEVFAILRAYGMPMPVARRLVRRIVRLTLKYSK